MESSRAFELASALLDEPLASKDFARADHLLRGRVHDLARWETDLLSARVALVRGREQEADSLLRSCMSAAADQTQHALRKFSAREADADRGVRWLEILHDLAPSAKKPAIQKEISTYRHAHALGQAWSFSPRAGTDADAPLNPVDGIPSSVVTPRERASALNERAMQTKPPAKESRASASMSGMNDRTRLIGLVAGGCLALIVVLATVLWFVLRSPVEPDPGIGQTATVASAQPAPAPQPEAIAAPEPATRPDPLPAITTPQPAPDAAPPPRRATLPSPPRSSSAPKPTPRPPSRSATQPRRPAPAAASAPAAPAAAAPAPDVPAEPPASAVASTVGSVQARQALEAGARSENAGDLAAAIRHYERARALDSSLTVISNASIARVRNQMGSSSSEAYRRARQYDAVGRVTDAIRWYDRAVRTMPEGPEKEVAARRLAMLRGEQ
jgi:tetratricopeptide (TPR) repeat protein